jgi:hypothetical protein
MSTQGNGRLVGYSPGGPSADPGNRDLSVPLAATFTSVPPTAAESSGLALAGSPRPVLGSTVVLSTSLIPAGTSLGAVIFGLARLDPGIDLSSLGMPGCLQFDNAVATRTFPVSGSTASANLFVPNRTTFVGVHVYAQTATFTPGFNALGLITSNGVDLKVGNL